MHGFLGERLWVNGWYLAHRRRGREQWEGHSSANQEPGSPGVPAGVGKSGRASFAVFCTPHHPPNLLPPLPPLAWVQAFVSPYSHFISWFNLSPK